MQKIYSDVVDSAQIKDKEKPNNKLSFIILVGFVVLLPLFFIPFPAFPFFFSKAILISLTTILLSVFWIINRLKDGKFPITTNPILIIGGVIPMVYLLSALISGSIMRSFIGQGYELDTFVFVLFLFLLMFLTTKILETKERIYYLFFSFFISFLLLSVFQIVRLFTGTDFLSLGVFTEPTSNLIGKWNELSIFYGLIAMLSLLIIEFVNNSKFVKIFGYISLVISLFFIALINFSAVWIVLGLFSFVLISYVISSNKFNENVSRVLKSNKFPVVSLLIVLMAIVFILGNNNIGIGLSNFFEISSSEVRPSWAGTSDVVKGTLKTKEAFFGAGPNQFVNQWLIHKPISVNYTAFWNSDFNVGVSTIYSSLVSVGLIGFILWILFIGLLFYTGFKFIFIPSKNKIDGYLLPLSFLSTVYLWLFSIIYIPTHVITALTFIFTGVLLSLLIQNKAIDVKQISFNKNQRTDFILVLVLIFMMIAFVVGGFFISQKFMAATYSQKGLMEINEEGGIEKTEQKIIKAINLSKNDSYYRFLSEINLIKLQELLINKDFSEEELSKQFQVLLNEAVTNSQKAIEIDKTNYQNWVSAGRVYESVVLFGVQGAYNQAMDAYIRAVNLNPKNPSLMLSLGLLQFNNKDYENAVSVLENAVILKPDYSNAKYYLGLNYYYLNRVNDAILQFKDLVSLNPDNKEIKDILENLEDGYSPFAGMSKTQTSQVLDLEEDSTIIEE